MTNNILALIIIAAGIIGCSRNNRALSIAMLAVIGVVMLFVSASAAAVSNFGPLFGVLGFVGAFALITLFRRRR